MKVIFFGVTIILVRIFFKYFILFITDKKNKKVVCHCLREKTKPAIWEKLF